MNRKRIFAAASVLSFFSGWAAAESTALLTVSRYETALAGMPRTVLLSDLHKRQFGVQQKRLLRQVAALKPELIVITGDLVSRSERDFTAAGKLLQNLGDIAPVIVSEGNHETDLPPEVYARFRKTVQKSGAQYLHNRIISFGNIHIAGLALPGAFYRGGGLFGFRGKYICTAETVRQFLGECPPDTLLLAHNPLFFAGYAEWGAKLTLSGHVHGGTVRLPLIGGLLSPERKFFPKYSRGRYQKGDAEMIVSTGLGKPRLNNPPEIVFLQH